MLVGSVLRGDVVELGVRGKEPDDHGVQSHHHCPVNLYVRVDSMLPAVQLVIPPLTPFFHLVEERPRHLKHIEGRELQREEVANEIEICRLLSRLTFLDAFLCGHCIVVGAVVL